MSESQQLQLILKHKITFQYFKKHTLTKLNFFLKSPQNSPWILLLSRLYYSAHRVHGKLQVGISTYPHSLSAVCTVHTYTLPLLGAPLCPAAPQRCPGGPGVSSASAWGPWHQYQLGNHPWSVCKAPYSHCFCPSMPSSLRPTAYIHCQKPSLRAASSVNLYIIASKKKTTKTTIKHFLSR